MSRNPQREESPPVQGGEDVNYEHHGVVLFSGPTGVGKTTVMNAAMVILSLCGDQFQTLVQ